MRRERWAWRWGLLGLGVIGASCYRDVSLDDPPIADFVEPRGRCVAPSPVDLVFVIEDADPAGVTQAQLRDALPTFFTRLGAGYDANGDGVADVAPITDVQVAVVSADLGAGLVGVGGCDAAEGDDGLFRQPAGRTCVEREPPVARASEVTALTPPVQCLVELGEGGCPHGAPLEAVLKALSPSAPTNFTGPGYRSPEFADGTLGHGLGAHAGFVREDSLLAIVVVSTRDDCSAIDRSFLRDDATPPALRCSDPTTTLLPTRRYVDGLVALRAARPDLLAFAVIAGLPEDASGALDSASYEALLDDPRMARRIDRSGTTLEAACVGATSAPPARRLVEVARGVGAGRSAVHSVCAPTLEPAMESIATLFARRACGTRSD